MRADELARRVLDVYLKDELEPRPAPVADASERRTERPFIDLEPAEYRRFLGGYRLDAEPSVLLWVTREGEWFVGGIAGVGTDYFRPVAQSEFENRNRNCQLVFFADDGENSARRVRITLQGQEMWATRVELPPDVHPVEDFLGFYYSDELEAAFEIVRGSDGLAVCTPDSDRLVLRADTDVLAGGIGILTFRRDDSGEIVGFDFREPEDFGQRLIRFDRCERCGSGTKGVP